MTRRRDAIARICPTCGAFAGSPCVGARGVRRAVHQSRFQGEKVVSPRQTASGIMSQDALVDQIVKRVMESQENFLRYNISAAMEACESPIERVLMAAFVAYSSAHENADDTTIYARRRTELPVPAFDGLHLYPQVSVDGYRLDFLAIDMFEGEQKYTVIEVDGHDFHERSKKQASYDKQRDRHFTKKGWQVLRYAGSDIWRAPYECAREAILTARGLGEEA